MLKLELEHYADCASLNLDCDPDDIKFVWRMHNIDSAINSPFAGFGDYEHYPEDHQKVAVLGYRLIKAHGLPDGNKRTALCCMHEFACINDYELDFDDEDAVFDWLNWIAADEDEARLNGFIEFVRCHLEALPSSNAV